MSGFKFRAWHKPTGRMIPWDMLSGLLDGKEIRVPFKPSRPSRDIPMDTEFQEARIRPPCNIFIHPDLVVMQWTGLLDGFGDEIFQGDIIASDSHNPNRFAVDFIEGGFAASHPKLIGCHIEMHHLSKVPHSERLAVAICGNVWEKPKWSE